MRPCSGSSLEDRCAGARPDRSPGSRIVLLPAPSRPRGQWLSAGFVPDYSDGVAAVFNRLPWAPLGIPGANYAVTVAESRCDRKRSARGRFGQPQDVLRGGADHGVGAARLFEAHGGRAHLRPRRPAHPGADGEGGGSLAPPRRGPTPDADPAGHRHPPRPPRGTPKPAPGPKTPRGPPRRRGSPQPPAP